MRHSIHLNFNGDGDLLLDLLCRSAWPLGNDLHVVIGNVWVSFDGEIMKRDGAPEEQHNRESYYHPAVVEREIDEGTHYRSPARTL